MTAEPAGVLCLPGLRLGILEPGLYYSTASYFIQYKDRSKTGKIWYLLAPPGALVVILVYYIHTRSTHFIKLFRFRAVLPIYIQ